MLALWGQVLAKFDPAGSQVSVLSLKKKNHSTHLHVCHQVEENTHEVCGQSEALSNNSADGCYG